MMRAAFLLLFLSSVVRAGEKPAVVELFEDDAATLIPQLTNNDEPDLGGGKVEAEKADVFSGKLSLRVGPLQRFSPRLKGWDFPIVEKPGPDEYRFVRFAWKKTENTSAMIQFCSQGNTWGQRYIAGPNPPEWPAKQVSPDSPRDWVVVTRDLFRDFGPFKLTGIAFSPMGWGGQALFDHVVLGRTLEDLDQHTMTVLRNTHPAVKLTAVQMEEHWKNLASWDDVTSLWRLTAHRGQLVRFAEQKLAVWKPVVQHVPDMAKAKQLLTEAVHHRFVVREAAARELMKLGDGVLPLVNEAAERATGEEKIRLQFVLKKWSGEAVNDRTRFDRCRLALAEVDTPEAKALLDRLNKLFKTPPEKKP